MPYSQGKLSDKQKSDLKKHMDKHKDICRAPAKTYLICLSLAW